MFFLWTLKYFKSFRVGSIVIVKIVIKNKALESDAFEFQVYQ